MPKRPGYLVVEIDVIDPTMFQEYVSKVRPTLAEYNARLVMRGEGRAKEGPAPVGMIIVIEFNSVEDAEHWYTSRPAIDLAPLRQRSANARLFIVEGEPQ